MMCNIFKNIFFLLLFSTYLFSSSEVSKVNLTSKEREWIRSNPEVTVSTLDDFPPFSYIENNKPTGLTHDVLEKIAEMTGLKFNIKSSHWSKALSAFKNGKTDLITDISYTKKREPFTLFSKPYYEIPNYIFGTKDDLSYKDNQSLKGKTVAITRGVFYKDLIKKLGINVFEVDTLKEKAKAVIEGKADYFISSYTKGIKVIRENSISNLKVIDEFYGIKKEDLRFGINIDKPYLYSIIEKALDKISPNEKTLLSNKWIVFAQENLNYKKINFSDEELVYIKNHPIIKFSEINWMPLSLIENNTMSGIMGDFLKIISVRTGLKFQLVPSSSWEDVLKKFNEKRIDLIPGIGSSPQEKSLGLISKKYAEFPMVIITGPKYSYINSLLDLKNKVIAVPKYYTSYNYIEKNYPNIKILETNDIKEALLLVENGEADAFVGHIAASIFYISQLHLSDLKISGSTLFDFKHRYLIQKDNPILLSIINKGIDSITQKEKKEIYSNWIQNTVVENKLDYKVLIGTLIITCLIIIGFTYRQYLLKKYNNKLKQSYEDIESIINSTMEAIMLTENRKCIYVNESAMKLFKMKKEEIIGRDFLEFIANEDRQNVRNSLLKEVSEPFEVSVLTSDNKIIPGLGRGTTLRLNDKIIRISSFVDLSEVKSKEKLLIEQSKMAALGEMIGHIAHQWRQPLSTITTISSSWSLYDEIGRFDKDKVLTDSKLIISNANYLSQTIDDFRTFIKGENTVKEFNIKDLIANLNRLVFPSLQSAQVKVTFINELDKLLVGSQNEMLQALINIINNAVDALNQNIKSGDRLLFIEVTLCKNCVCISIKDNAGGIPEKIKEKIFEPYFTTKHESKGTGLGLYMAYSIVKKIGGEISVSNIEYEYDNKKQKGANFLISLNCVE